MQKNHNTGLLFFGASYLILLFVAVSSSLAYLKKSQELAELQEVSRTKDELIDIQKDLIDICINNAEGTSDPAEPIRLPRENGVRT